MRISDKGTMYDLLYRGCLGNRARMWFHIRDMVADGYSGLVGIRSKKQWGKFCAHIPADQVANFLYLYPEGYILSEMQDDERIVLQGEYYDAPVPYLFCSSKKAHMRVALATASKSYYGLAARMLLRACMDPSSYEDFEHLRSAYPDSVIEFSCYSSFVGVLPHRNTLFWEVRNY